MYQELLRELNDLKRKVEALERLENGSGATGAQGVFGGDSMEYAFSTTTTDSDPGSGIIRFNHGTFASITQLFIDDANAAAADAQAWLATFDDSTNTIKGTLRVFKKSDSAIYRDFLITAITEATGYWKVTVTPVVSAGALVDTDAVVVSFVRAGNLGATGAQGGFGGDSMKFLFSTNTASSDPGTGKLKFNATQTELNVAGHDFFGVDINNWLQQLNSGSSSTRGVIRIYEEANPGNFCDLLLTSASWTGAYSIMVVSLQSGVTTFTNNLPVVMSFARTGDKGDDSDLPATIGSASTDDSIADADIWAYLTGGVLVKTTWANIQATIGDEGTFTPVVADASSGGNAASAATSLGWYTQIGNRVFIDINIIDINTTGLTAGNTIHIRSLPLTSISTANYFATGVVGFNRLTFTMFVTAQISAGITYLTLNEHVSGNVNANAMIVSDIAGASQTDLRISISYEVN